MWGCSRSVENASQKFNELVTSTFLSRIIEESGGKLDEAEEVELKATFAKIGAEMSNAFEQHLSEWEQTKFVSPVVDIVGDLPKDDLAAIAESLVNLTSFKHKITAEAETVGGPIDVAVISKGDGFIWIKRKHYFQKDLNPVFFTNYFRSRE